MLQSEGTPKELVIRQGEWSDWLRVKFKVGLLQSIRGMMRFYLQSCEPELALYASPVNFDPHSPLFPISDPPEYAGRACPTHRSLLHDRHGRRPRGTEQRAHLRANIPRSVRDRLARARGDDARRAEAVREGFFYCLFDTPDRIQHLFWRFTEPDHPANHGVAPSAEFARVIDDCYRRCDAIVGKALEFSDDETLFIALSDHGFNSFRRGVHLNTWLYDNGFLALRDGVKPGEAAGDLLRQVDWGRTKAYAVGLGGIYLNIEGSRRAGDRPERPRPRRSRRLLCKG